MKIVVTGAAGFIGSHLAEKLVAQGHTVVGIDCFTPYYSRDLKDLNVSDLEKKGISILPLDLATDDISHAVKDVDFIYHLAAQPGISSSTTFGTYLKNNVIATYKLLEAVKEQKSLKCFVNIATSSVYGAHATDTEDVAPKPTSYYGVTKLAAEQLALSYFRDRNLPVCSMRLFSVFGERERPEKLYPKLIRSILDGTKFPLFEGSKSHLRSYTYVGDIVSGLLLILDNTDNCLGEIFNIGCDTAITTGEGIEIVENILDKKAVFDMKPKRAGDQLETHANIQKAKRILGYNPTTSPQEGLQREVAWFKDKFYD